jgi:hypothetical protein
LIVDDDSEICTLLSNFLAKYGDRRRSRPRRWPRNGRRRLPDDTLQPARTGGPHSSGARRAAARGSGAAPGGDEVYEFAGWRLDVPRRQLFSPAAALVMLRAAEFDILLALVERPQRTLTRDQLLDLARGPRLVTVRPSDRSSHQPAAQEDRGRSEGAGDDQDGAQRRLLLCHSGHRLGGRAIRRRWRFDSIAMTVAPTVLVAMGLGAALQRVVNAGLEYTGNYPWQTSEDFRTHLSAALFPATVVSLAEALDTVPNMQRLPIITAARRPEIGSTFAMRRCCRRRGRASCRSRSTPSTGCRSACAASTTTACRCWPRSRMICAPRSPA